MPCKRQTTHPTKDPCAPAAGLEVLRVSGKALFDEFERLAELSGLGLLAHLFLPVERNLRCI
jgi:hypothetical protein